MRTQQASRQEGEVDKSVRDINRTSKDWLPITKLPAQEINIIKEGLKTRYHECKWLNCVFHKCRISGD